MSSFEIFAMTFGAIGVILLTKLLLLFMEEKLFWNRILPKRKK